MRAVAFNSPNVFTTPGYTGTELGGAKPRKAPRPNQLGGVYDPSLYVGIPVVSTTQAAAPAPSFLASLSRTQKIALVALGVGAAFWLTKGR